MMPVYRHMDSYPHQRSQSGHQQVFPAYPSNPPMVCEPWPHSGSYGYPMPCGSCCGHGNSPGFHCFGPSYPRPMPSPPVRYCPAPYYPEAYPVYYLPPSHYSVEMPRYECEKRVPRSREYHCCGCPNHHRREDKGVRIEEQEEPEVAEPKGKGSLVPVQMKGYPHQVVWVPEEYLKEKSRPFEAEEKRRDSVVDSRGKERNGFNGWLPLGGDEVKYLMDGGDEKRARDWMIPGEKECPFPVIMTPSDDGDQEGGKKEVKDMSGGPDTRSEDQKRQFPFPIIWMTPQDTRQKEVGDKDGKEANVSPVQAENLPYIFNFFPMKQICGKNTSEDPKVNEENIVGKDKDSTELNAKEKSATQKNDSAKQGVPSKEEERPKPDETKKEVSKPSGTEGKKQPSPSPKSFKLPPVCLRVDPLPKKKNGNGSSRSPSPPAKERSQNTSNESVSVSVGPKDNAQKELNENSSSNNKDAEPKKMEPKVIAVTEKASDLPQVSVERTEAKVSENLPDEKAAKDGNQSQMQDEMRTEVNSGNERRAEKKALSDLEAALRIQSAYRGFEIRRSQPLKKLKQITEVRDQVADVRDRIRALESSSDARKDDKQKLIIGETIMRLLLQLDTIQGLHPSLRDVRKSLAKELVSLQEKLDSLVIEREEPKSEACSAGPVEDLGIKADSKQEQREETESDRSSEDVIKTTRDVPATDSEHTLECEGALLSASDNVVSSVASEGNGREVQVNGVVKPEEPSLEATLEQNGKARDVVPRVCATESMDTVEENKAPEVPPEEVAYEYVVEAPELEKVPPEEVAEESVVAAPEFEKASEVPSEEVSKESEKNEYSTETVNGTNDDSSGIDLGEPSAEATDEERTKSKLEAKQVEPENNDEVQSVIASEVTSQAIVEEAMMHELAELPVGVLDEDINKESPVKESEPQDTTETALPKDETAFAIKEPYETLEVKPVMETLDEHSMSSEPEESPAPISIVVDESQNSSDECSEANNVQAKEGPVENEAAAKEVNEATRETKVNASDGVTAEPELERPTRGGGDMSKDGSETRSERDERLARENEKLKEMMEKLLEAGKEQLNVISSLSGRVKDLEKQLARRKKLRPRHNRTSPKRSTVNVKDRAIGVAK